MAAVERDPARADPPAAAPAAAARPRAARAPPNADAARSPLGGQAAAAAAAADAPSRGEGALFEGTQISDELQRLRERTTTLERDLLVAREAAVAAT